MEAARKLRGAPEVTWYTSVLARAKGRAWDGVEGLLAGAGQALLLRGMLAESLSVISRWGLGGPGWEGMRYAYVSIEVGVVEKWGRGCRCGCLLLG